MSTGSTDLTPLLRLWNSFFFMLIISHCSPIIFWPLPGACLQAKDVEPKLETYKVKAGM